jgi:hypothetical protein
MGIEMREMGTGIAFLQYAAVCGLALAGCQSALIDGDGSEASAPLVRGPLVRADFKASALGKCLDFTGSPAVGSPVYLWECNGTSAQQIKVEEIDGSHDVQLKSGSLCVGVKNATFRVGQPLELQTCRRSPYTSQRFAFDGDSLLTGPIENGHVNRTYVVEVQGGRPINGTPLVVRSRELDDSELWTFTAWDGSTRRPTSAFATVWSKQDIVSVLDWGWGAVAEVPDGITIDMSVDLPRVPGCTAGDTPSINPVLIPGGATLRSNRHAQVYGGELWFKKRCKGVMLQVLDNDARITGLRLRGPTDSRDDGLGTQGIKASTRQRVFIDHNEIRFWPLAAVGLEGDDLYDDGTPVGDDPADPRANDSKVCYPGVQLKERPYFARVVRNFIHHNEMDQRGYGVVTSHAGFSSIEGNVFSMNRHSLTSDYRAATGYRAYDNLVLSKVPEYWGGFVRHNDFDMHGSGFGENDAYKGGRAGDYFDFEWNTFLGTNHENVYVRGTPCRYLKLHGNYFVQSRGDALHRETSDAVVIEEENDYNANNPTREVAVGDFDGDGIQDLFLATGAAWYYSSGGKMEWRLLRREWMWTPNMRFGDFDGDGRTDVLSTWQGSWVMSWGGRSEPELVNSEPGEFNDFRVGDFDGDGKSDVLLANGTDWLISYDARSHWQWMRTSSLRSADLRFGDFDGDGRTDVLAKIGSNWVFTGGGTGPFVTLRAAQSGVNNPLVADFDGNGLADIAWSSSTSGTYAWVVAPDGRGASRTIRTSAPVPLVAEPVGRFDEGPSADALEWDEDNHTRLWSGAKDYKGVWSLQELR